ncbi:hypothetical protein [Shinella sedimenti]|uniref:Uncharacterized protein n=1 Tax=Shinella sedimenti TaxID=2919913 RepID=A0ABT0CLG2_9HYPH|nr:hypothetical protein [Shinella sedimenti]MCJ8149094.1 hypothetical protein [Shinella sedimenti]
MLRELLYELTRGFAYRQIKHPEMRKYTTWLPIFVYSIIAFVYLGLGLDFRWLGSNGVFDKLQTILSTLPGFYFAGLAAVATFGGAGMDNKMPDPTPLVNIRVRGKSISHPLTRRQFLSYLFSYLVILSLLLCLLLLCINAMASVIPNLEKYFEAMPNGPYIWWLLEFLVGSGLLLGFSSMLITTLHGIFFLTERMHQP